MFEKFENLGWFEELDDQALSLYFEKWAQGDEEARGNVWEHLYGYVRKRYNRELLKQLGRYTHWVMKEFEEDCNISRRSAFVDIPDIEEIVGSAFEDRFIKLDEKVRSGDFNFRSSNELKGYFWGNREKPQYGGFYFRFWELFRREYPETGGYDQQPFDNGPLESGPDNTLERKQVHIYLFNLVNTCEKLTFKEVLVIVLRYYDGYDDLGYKEILRLKDKTVGELWDYACSCFADIFSQEEINEYLSEFYHREVYPNLTKRFSYFLGDKDLVQNLQNWYSRRMKRWKAKSEEPEGTV